LEYEERDEDVSRVLLWMLFGSTWVTSNGKNLFGVNRLDSWIEFHSIFTKDEIFQSKNDIF